MADGVLVRIEGVSRDFRVGIQDIHALRDVSFEVNQGDFVAIIGRSGSGKTTLLNVIAGLDRPSKGHVYIEGQDVSQMTDAQLTELRRHKIGFVFQSFGLLPLLSAYENVEVALRIAGAGIRERGRRAHELLDMVGLGRRAPHRPHELSGGGQPRAPPPAPADPGPVGGRERRRAAALVAAPTRAGAPARALHAAAFAARAPVTLPRRQAGAPLLYPAPGHL